MPIKPYDTERGEAENVKGYRLTQGAVLVGLQQKGNEKCSCLQRKITKQQDDKNVNKAYLHKQICVEISWEKGRVRKDDRINCKKYNKIYTL